MKKAFTALLIISMIYGCSTVKMPAASSPSVSLSSGSIEPAFSTASPTASSNQTQSDVFVSSTETPSISSSFEQTVELKPSVPPIISSAEEKSEYPNFMDGKNVLISYLPKDTAACFIDCYELNKENYIIIINYFLRSASGKNHFRILRYDRALLKETPIYDGQLSWYASQFIAGEGNSFALFCEYGYIIFEDDQLKESIPFGEKYDELCVYLSSDFTKMISRSQDGVFSLLDTKTLEKLFVFEKGDFMFPIFEKNQYILRDWNHNIFVIDLDIDSKKQCLFDGNITNARYYEDTGTLYFLDADQGDQSNAMTVYAFNPDSMKIWTHLYTQPKDGDVTDFDFNQTQYSFRIRSENGWRIKTFNLSDKTVSVSEREYMKISKITYFNDSYAVIQCLDYIVLIYI